MTTDPIALDHAHPAAPLRGAWTVDAETSHARFTATTLAGLVKTPGQFGALSGELTVEDSDANGVLKIDAASIDTGNRLRDRHLRGPDFFDAGEHPELRYELGALTPAGQEQLLLDGRLTIAGTTTTLPLDAKLRVHTDELVEISARTKVDRVALGVRGARGMVPRTVELDIRIVVRRTSG